MGGHWATYDRPRGLVDKLRLFLTRQSQGVDLVATGLPLVSRFWLRNFHFRGPLLAVPLSRDRSSSCSARNRRCCNNGHLNFRTAAVSLWPIVVGEYDVVSCRPANYVPLSGDSHTGDCKRFTDSRGNERTHVLRSVPHAQPRNEVIYQST